jgi:hypothetical protein
VRREALIAKRERRCERDDKYQQKEPRHGTGAQVLLAVEPPMLAVYVIRATTKRSPGKDGGAGASAPPFSKADPVDAKELRCASASGELRHASHYQL